MPHAVFLLFNRNGEEELVLVAKATYGFDASGALSIAQEQESISPVDRHWGEPGKSGVRYESDLAPRKERIDLLLNGTAHAPGGRPVTQLMVEFRTRHFSKRALVSGDRRWLSGLTGTRPSAPVPFRAMPVTYERAFGGTDTRGQRTSRHASEMRNPVGVGFHSTGVPVEGELLPNVEDPRHLQHAWDDRCAPIGFAAVSRSWQPRAGYAGTYDADWLEKRFPLLPHDFDERHYQCAPVEQQLPCLEPGEPVLLRNFTPGGELRLELPVFRVPVYLRRDRESVRVVITCDTVLIEPDLQRVVLSGRICAPLGRKFERLREVVIGALSAGEERAVLSGKRYKRLGSASAADVPGRL
jgi:hypothetical protein